MSKRTSRYRPAPRSTVRCALDAAHAASVLMVGPDLLRHEGLHAVGVPVCAKCSSRLRALVLTLGTDATRWDFTHLSSSLGQASRPTNAAQERALAVKAAATVERLLAAQA
jgi:hypothetical protein